MELSLITQSELHMELLSYSAFKKSSILLSPTPNTKKTDVEMNWLYKISGSKSGEKITIILFFSINKEALSSPTLGLFASQYPQ